MNCNHTMTDTTGAVVWRAAYNPFGEFLASTGGLSVYDDYAWEPVFRFAGQYEDMDTAYPFPLVYNWNRYYMPRVGRYNQVDPAGVLPPGLAWRHSQE